MKKILTFLFAFLVGAICLGQTQRSKTISFELGIGGLVSFDKLFFDSVGPGLSPYCELRYNFKNIPIDIGIDASVQIFSRGLNNNTEKLDFISKNLFLVSDYHFSKTRDLYFFAGVGIGLGFFDYSKNIRRIDTGTYADYVDSMLSIMPRIGIEAWDHLGISIGYMIEDKANRNLNLRIGYVF